jgi:hypothetical protein
MRGTPSPGSPGFGLWWRERLQVQANPGQSGPTTPPPRPLPQIPFLLAGAGEQGTLSRMRPRSDPSARGMRHLGQANEGRSPSLAPTCTP